jgi:hypothetical protein
VARANRQSAASSSSTAAWTILIASLAVGAATTVYGTTITCAEADARCRRRASLAIWGGVGIASLGSAIALGSMQHDDARPARASRALHLLLRAGADSERRVFGTSTQLSIAGVFD